jgi:glutamyl-tRNA reductase
MSDELFVVGLSHHTAPIAVRERLAVATEAVGSELRELLQAGPIAEGILLSTCNRVELYAAAPDPVAAVELAKKHLRARAHPDDIGRFVYERLGSEAVLHAFRVSSSLDSMVVGEPQILGQVKAAFATAEASGAVGTMLTRLFQRGFAVAKRIRTETGIAEGAVSVSSIAIELASKIFGTLEGCQTLLVGAGKMSEAAAKSLAARGARLVVVNRSPERARELAAACGGEAREYERLPAELIAADVVISSTASPRFVITTDLMKEVVKARKRRRMFLIDIAVPRDIDPRCGEMENVFLYDVDDLQKVAAENMTHRQRAAEAAERLVLEETESFEKWRRTLTLKPTMVALREQFQTIRKAEIEKTLPRMSLSDADRQLLEKMTEAMINKMLHPALTELRESAERHDAPLLIDATRRLFRLDNKGESAPAREAEPRAELSPAASKGKIT